MERYGDGHVEDVRSSETVISNPSYSCRICKSKSSVIGTRKTLKGQRRRRQCKKCNYIWFTLELNETDVVRRPEKRSGVRHSKR